MFPVTKPTRRVLVIISCGTVVMILKYGLAAYLSDKQPVRNAYIHSIGIFEDVYSQEVLSNNSSNSENDNADNITSEVSQTVTKVGNDRRIKERFQDRDLNEDDKYRDNLVRTEQVIATADFNHKPGDSDHGINAKKQGDDLIKGDNNRGSNTAMTNTSFLVLKPKGGNMSISRKNYIKNIRKTEVSVKATQRPDLLKQGSRQLVYLCVNARGRLGNIMFEVSAMLGTARRYSVTPCIPEEGKLDRIFEIPYAKFNRTVRLKFKRYHDSYPCAYKPVVTNFTSNITMMGYYQSWRYFENVFPEIRKTFTFLGNIRTSARDSLINSIQLQHGNISFHNLTFVGIHIRRGDMVETDVKKYGYKVGSVHYLQKAMSYFRERFSSVMFVVCSNDMEWSKKVIAHTEATFSMNQSAEVDLAILSQCNHTIMTVGSYGWWAGWLAGGITIYQRQQFRKGSMLSNGFNMTDYMLPEWIPIDEH